MIYLFSFQQTWKEKGLSALFFCFCIVCLKYFFKFKRNLLQMCDTNLNYQAKKQLDAIRLLLSRNYVIIDLEGNYLTKHDEKTIPKQPRKKSK